MTESLHDLAWGCVGIALMVWIGSCHPLHAQEREPTPQFKALKWTLRGVIIADAITTHVAIRNYHAREVMMPMGNPWVIDTALGFQTISAPRSLSVIDELDHPTLARWLGWTLVAIHAGAVANNLHQMQRAGR